MIIKFIKVEWRESSTNEQLPPNPTHKFLCDGGGPYSLGPKSLWLMIKLVRFTYENTKLSI